MYRSPRILAWALSSASGILSLPLFAADSPEQEFTRFIQPILESACIRCHDSDNAEADLLMTTREALLAGGDSGASLVPGKPEESLILTLAALPSDDPDVMPPKEEPLDPEQLERLRAWIASGAPWPEGVVLEDKPRITFREHIQPLLEVHCVSCHKPENAEGDLDLTTRAKAFSTGDSSPCLQPYAPDESLFLILASLPADDPDLMPPAKDGGPLPAQDIERIRLWISQGAVWPSDLELTQRAKDSSEQPPSPDNLELVQRIRDFIIETSGESAAAPLEPYTHTVPVTDAVYHMVPVPGGEFTLGSSASEENRADDEGPAIRAVLEPFWIGKYEVTWPEYKPFMITPVDRYKDGAKKNPAPGDTDLDAVSMPTTPYQEMSFGMGQDGFPAISMTQHAANKYCQWLSLQTGHFYRLPTEAEWEYACRAGTSTVYSFGDDPSQLGDYAWHFENSDGKYQPVGQKKPNPWGLYDMHGNVVEWTLDQYSPDGYADFAALASPAIEPFRRPVKLYPRVARGGHWDDDPELLRSAARTPSSAAWKRQDPQLPKSIWYHTDAKWLGFRLVRPAKVPSAEEMFYYWNCGRPEKVGLPHDE